NPEEWGARRGGGSRASGRRRISHGFAHRVRVGSAGGTHVGRDRGNRGLRSRRRRRARSDAAAGGSRADQEGAAEAAGQTAGAGPLARPRASRAAAGRGAAGRGTSAADSARLLGLDQAVREKPAGSQRQGSLPDDEGSAYGVRPVRGRGCAHRNGGRSEENVTADPADAPAASTGNEGG